MQLLKLGLLLSRCQQVCLLQMLILLHRKLLLQVQAVRNGLHAPLGRLDELLMRNRMLALLVLVDQDLAVIRLILEQLGVLRLVLVQFDLLFQDLARLRRPWGAALGPAGRYSPLYLVALVFAEGLGLTGILGNLTRKKLLLLLCQLRTVHLLVLPLQVDRLLLLTLAGAKCLLVSTLPFDNLMF